MRVLIAEDDAISRTILRRALQSMGHSCLLANDGIEAWQRLVEDKPDIVISDWLMPGMDGIDICRKLRATEAGSYTYFIFITALGDKHHFVKGMEAGADDYLTKPIDLDELAARLVAAARVTSLHRRLIEQNVELERLGRLSFEAARTDPLTLVGNRLRLRDDFDRMRGRVERYGQRYAAALCDVDMFKDYNDRYGHMAGDEALVAVASTLTRTLREGDAVYRYGGEEFLVILPEQTAASAVVAMDRVRVAVERLGIEHAGNAPLGVVTMSVGVAEVVSSDKPPWEKWLKRADLALYAAKSQGRNRVCVYEASTPDRSSGS